MERKIESAPNRMKETFSRTQHFIGPDVNRFQLHTNTHDSMIFDEHFRKFTNRFHNALFHRRRNYNTTDSEYCASFRA